MGTLSVILIVTRSAGHSLLGNCWLSRLSSLTSFSRPQLPYQPTNHIPLSQVSVLPALFNHLESALCEPFAPTASNASVCTLLHCDLAYTDPNTLFR